MMMKFVEKGKTIKGLVMGLLIVLTLSTGKLYAQKEASSASLFNKSVEFCAATKNRVSKSVFLPPLPGIKIDIFYLNLILQLNPEVNYIHGEAMIHYRAKSKGDTVALYLHDSIAVTEVKFRNTHLTSIRPGGHILILPLETTIQPGVEDSLYIRYEGIPGTLAGQKGVFTALLYGKPYLWTLSEPYGSPAWWPSKLNLDDKIDSLQITISHPAAFRSAANGMRIKEIRTDSTATTIWKHRYPIVPYLIGVAVGDYAVYEEDMETSAGNIHVMNFAYPEDSATVREATGALAPVYRLYDSLFGPYPFIHERYGHLQCPMGGGMEHQTLTFVGPFSHHVLSHEFAHSWFGNKVTTGSWKDIWLNEGFATYATGLTYQYLFNGIYWEPWKKETILAVCSKPDGSVYVDDTTEVSRIFDARLSYHKAALLLHMIRWIIGDTAFFDALRTYLGYPGLSYGFARTDDLIGIFEETSGKNLSGFMNQWFYGEGYPMYTLKWGMSAADTLRITLYQQTSHPSVSFFDIPVEIMARKAQKDTLITLYPSYNGQAFNIPIRFTPDSLLFDPRLRIISAGNQILGIENTGSVTPNIEIYPNPARSYTLVGGEAKTAAIAVYDNAGRLLWKQNRPLPAEISLDGWSRGVYFISIETPETTIKRKLIVQ
ncbi:MAG: M1 family aminopeptidase [Bacteroidota bacterium]